MNAVIKVIQRGLVIEFYKQNAAFFGFILLVFFGFIRGTEHLTIGYFIVNNPAIIFFLFILWLAYLAKVVLFMIPAINKPESQFLEVYILLDKKTKVATVISASLALLVPVIFYSGFLASLAFSSKSTISVVLLLSIVILLIMSLSTIINYQISGLPHEKKVFQVRIFKKITIPPSLFFVSYLSRHEIVLVLLSKIYGCLLIIGTSALYQTGDFDLRLLTTGILLASIGNVAILHKYVWFQYQPMAFSINMPFKFTKIVLGQITSLIIILIPEILVLIRHYPLEFSTINFAGEIIFAIGISHLMYGWMIRKQVELSDFMVVVFWLVVGTTFFILFSVHPLFLGILYLAISIFIIYIRHYQYEHID